jgi:hypothetical protein
MMVSEHFFFRQFVPVSLLCHSIAGNSRFGGCHSEVVSFKLLTLYSILLRIVFRITN